MSVPTLSMRARLAVLAVVLLPTVLAVLTFFATTSKVATAGDEPHYLIMADSLLVDHSFDLRPAYTRDAEAVKIVGPVTPHMYFIDHRWMPYHTPGLSILIALPFKLAGELGVRLFLCVLLAILPWSIVRWARTEVSLSSASWLTAGVVVCSPACFGASQIFPDLPAGIFATALTLWLLRRNGEEAHPAAWVGAGLAMGLILWLNVKFTAPAAVFFLGLVHLAWQARKAGRPTTRRWALVAAALVVIGPLSLLAFNLVIYQNVIGGRALKEVSSPPSRAAEMFLGLHLDQSQGMFVRNPLLLAGVLFLPLFFRRRPAQAVLWTLLYLSLVGPNSLEGARFGGGAPTSRFAWPAMWLWVVPIVVGLRELRVARWLLAPAALLGLCYQAWLAARWLPRPEILFPNYAEAIAERDSIFRPALRRILPSFYFWDFTSYWTYPPNVIAMGVIVGLLALGVVMAWRVKREAPAEV